LLSEKLEKEKRGPLVKKISSSKNEDSSNHYQCSFIKLNYDESIYTDIYLMKNYLIIIDKNYDIFYLNIESFTTDFLIYEDNNSENSDSSKSLNEAYRNLGEDLIEKSNYKTNVKEKKYLINENNEKVDKKSDKCLNFENINLINLDLKSNTNHDLNTKSKFEGYFDDQAKTNFNDILLKLNQNYNKIIKIDCSESNLLFADEDQKVN
jgi:hypothetical protein